MYIIVGLGNPGEEYENTRHNTGRIVLSKFIKDHGDGEMEIAKKYRALITTGTVEKEKVTVIFPETFMNKSGLSVAPLIPSVKKAGNLIVVYDDLDLALGTIRISYDRGSGGHRGVESIIKAVKTRAFVRIRVGISPTTPSGKLKKPHGEADVEKFILSSFSKKEDEILKGVSKKVSESIETVIREDKDVAMTNFN